MTHGALPSRLFRDRYAAGQALAAVLGAMAHRPEVVVLGLARGGVPVARVVADILGAPVDTIVVRKLGVPGMPEVALGAIAEGSRDVIEDSVRWYLGVPRSVFATIAVRERAEIEQRIQLYRGGRALPDVRGKTVVLVDDGLASGATLRAAALSLRKRRPAHIVAAVPVASPAHCDDVRKTVDDFVPFATPDPFETVSAWYEDFSPVSDADVCRLLRRVPGHASPNTDGAASASEGATDEREVAVPLSAGQPAQSLGADFGIPDGRVKGLVILAHGGGSSRTSYRNRYLAGRLRLGGWSTLRLDLLVPQEQEEDNESGAVRFDIQRIASRLTTATEWAASEGLPGADRIALFGASTGAAAAMVAAAARPDLVAAVASRGGRVDLAGDALRQVRAPVLMVVGGTDTKTLELNRDAARLLRRVRQVVVPGAGHTFDEPGAIGAVGEHVRSWLDRLGRREKGDGRWGTAGW